MMEKFGCDSFSYIDINRTLTYVYSKQLDNYKLVVDDDLYEFQDYCIAQYENDPTKSHRHPQIKLVTCSNIQLFVLLHHKIGPILSIVSIVFLIWAIAKHCKKKRLKHLWKILRLCLLSCILIFYVLEFIKPWYADIIMTNLCTSIGFCKQFLYLSIFSWMVVICYDAWKDTGRWQNQEERNSRLGFLDPRHPNIFKNSMKFIKRLLFATSIPFLVSFLTFIMMHVNKIPYVEGKNLPEWLYPSLGEQTCGFHVNYEKLIYWTIPSGILMLISFTFWCLRTKKFFESPRPDQSARGEGNRCLTNQMKAKEMAIFFLVIGLHWGIDILSTVIEHVYGKYNTVTLVINFVFDPFSYLNGLWLFIATPWNSRSDVHGRQNQGDSIEMQQQ